MNRFYKLLGEGMVAAKSHARLWLIFVLVIVFPLLFVFFYISESNIAKDNLTTVLSAKISTVHDALEAGILADADKAEIAAVLVERQSDIVKLQLVKEQNGTLFVYYDAFGGPENREVSTPEPFKTALIEPGTTYIFPYHTDTEHRDQAFRTVRKDTGEMIYIFTEHNFTPEYRLITSRGNQPLYILGFIFVFIMSLAYWLARQINYEKRYVGALKQLEERDLFTSSLVHELRAPLTAMRGYASMIEESLEVAVTEKEYALRIKDSTTRLVTLVNDFLEAARIQSGKLPLQFAAVEVSEVVKKVLRAAALSASTKGLLLKDDLTAIEIETDAKRLEQVVTNLVSNAIKYTKQGSITISLERQLNSLDIIIADTGSGISAEDQRKLFAPFVRVGDSASKEAITGTGLGMWITKQLVTQLGGKIELESIKNVGTHVKINLPLKKKL